MRDRRRPRCRGELHALLAPYEGLYTVAPVEATFGSVARALGVVASVLERFDAAERHFAFAIETERKMKARPWRAHAQHNLAAMLLRRGAVGDDERALALLDEARDNYRELGMKSWAARASEATGAAPFPPVIAALTRSFRRSGKPQGRAHRTG